MAESAGAEGFASQPMVLTGSGKRYRKMVKLIQRKVRAEERYLAVRNQVDYQLGLLRDEEAASSGEDR